MRIRRPKVIPPPPRLRVISHHLMSPEAAARKTHPLRPSLFPAYSPKLPTPPRTPPHRARAPLSGRYRQVRPRENPGSWLSILVFPNLLNKCSGWNYIHFFSFHPPFIIPYLSQKLRMWYISVNISVVHFFLSSAFFMMFKRLHIRLHILNLCS